MMVLTEEGRFWILLVVFLFTIFASGYFLGWGRDKLGGRIFDKMLHYLDKTRYWQGRYEGTSADYADLLERYMELKEYAIDQLGVEHVPTKFGGELE